MKTVKVLIDAKQVLSKQISDKKERVVLKGLKKVLGLDKRETTEEIKVVLKAVCKHYGLTEEQIRNPRTYKEAKEPRMHLVYLCSKEMNITTGHIIKGFGVHASQVSIYTSTIETRLRFYPDLREANEAILSKLKNTQNA